eukprot:6187503-Pleurochrysis_carterae.AAC.1
MTAIKESGKVIVQCNAPAAPAAMQRTARAARVKLVTDSSPSTLCCATLACVRAMEGANHARLPPWRHARDDATNLVHLHILLCVRVQSTETMSIR